MKKETKKEQIKQLKILPVWPTGMSEYEISEKLGVSIKTVKEVMEDLNENDERP
ncbi:MAG: hypothetical protein GX175_00295 [Halanaerobiaceae bacterium]|jgi:transposase|nr:hypothetical protein [Halanaerobiaceae bacterium]